MTAKNIKRFVSPFFLNRYYLYRDTKQMVEKYKFEGAILDIGCGVKPYKPIFRYTAKYIGIDFKKYSKNDNNAEKPDLYFESNYEKTLRLPFSNSSYNHTVAFQVLEHHKQPEKLISEMYRITKNRGYILLTVPFLGGVHEEPHDYQRYTKYGLVELFRKYKCKVVELKSQGSIFSTISLLLNENICNFANKSRVNYFLSMAIYPVFLLFEYFSFIMDQLFKSTHIVRGYLILVKKL